MDQYNALLQEAVTTSIEEQVQDIASLELSQLSLACMGGGLGEIVIG
jgi:hypothetical protein